MRVIPADGAGGVRAVVGTAIVLVGTAVLDGAVTVTAVVAPAVVVEVLDSAVAVVGVVDDTGDVVVPELQAAAATISAPATVPPRRLLVLTARSQPALDRHTGRTRSVAGHARPTMSTTKRSGGWLVPCRRTMKFSILLSAVGMVGALAATPTLDWPGDPVVRVADEAGRLGANLSGLALDGSDRLWVVRDTGALLNVERDGDVWRPSDGWGDGRALLYPDGHEGPDAEAVTTVAGDDGAVYVGAERDNDKGGESRNSVLRYETGGRGAITATKEWDLTAVLPSSPANTGIEGLAWVPDDALVAIGLRTDAGTPYAPAALPAHGRGLFAVGLESDGGLYLVALTDGGGVSLVASLPSGLDRVMEVVWNFESQELWALCDNGCKGHATVLRGTGAGFEQVAEVKPPKGMADLNDEGFALLPCTDGANTVVWADDLATDDHALRTSSLPCGRVTGDAPPPTLVPTTVTIASTTPTTATASSAAAGATAAPIAPTTSRGSSAAPPTAPATTAPASTTNGDGGSGPLLAVVAAVALAAAGVGVVLARRRAR